MGVADMRAGPGAFRRIDDSMGNGMPHGPRARAGQVSLHYGARGKSMGPWRRPACRIGDGNGFASGKWHGPGDRWQLDLTPYYTRVGNDIDAIPTCGPECSGMPAAQLMFANHEARLYGADANASYALPTGPTSGAVRLTVAGNLVRGRDLTTGG